MTADALRPPLAVQHCQQGTLSAARLNHLAS